MSLLADAKARLRISAGTTAFDDEVQELIDAAKADIELAGVHATWLVTADDPLIKRAVMIYVKMGFGYDNPDADRFQRSYDALKTHLSASVDYVGVVPDET